MLSRSPYMLVGEHIGNKWRRRRLLWGWGEVSRRPLKELNRDLWRNFIDSLPNFIGSVRQPIRVNAYSYTAGTAHVILRLQVSYRLFQAMPAFRTLKRDNTGVNIGHRRMFNVVSEIAKAIEPPLPRLGLSK